MRKCIVEKLPDGSFKVSDYVNADGSAEIVYYKSTDDISKVNAILGKSLTGMSKDATVAIMELDEFGQAEKIQYIGESTRKDQPPEIVVVAVDAKPQLEAATDALKVEIDTKTGHVDPVKPKEEAAPGDAAAVGEPLTP